MKTNLHIPTLGLGFAALAGSGWAQDQPPRRRQRDAPAPETGLPASGEPGTGLRFNFRGAPLEMVLNYMSDAAGFVIVLETPVSGTVDMWSAQPVSKEEAVQLLNIALNKNGYSASVQGRNLIVSSKDDAKKQNIPIHTGNDPGGNSADGGHGDADHPACATSTRPRRRKIWRRCCRVRRRSRRTRTATRSSSPTPR